MPFTFQKLKIPDVVLIQSKIFPDERGFFLEVFNDAAYKAAGLPEVFAQDNFSHSKKGVIRGLHYQLSPFAQGKLVACVSGRIFDVAVDIRKDSPTFGKWVGEELSEENGRLLYIPSGFAHGFMALEENTRVLYKCTAIYHPGSERGLAWNDPGVAISWPDQNPIVNSRDAIFPNINTIEAF